MATSVGPGVVAVLSICGGGPRNPVAIGLTYPDRQPPQHLDACDGAINRHCELLSVLARLVFYANLAKIKQDLALGSLTSTLDRAEGVVDLKFTALFF